VRASQEIAQVHKFAVILVLDIDHTPAVLATTDLLSTNDNGLFTTDDCERYDILDLSVQGTLLLVEFLVVVGVHLEVVERKLLLYPLLEGSAFFEGERVGFGDHRNDIYNVRELLEDDNVDRFERMTRRLNEEETAVDAGILDVALSLGCKFFSEVC